MGGGAQEEPSPGPQNMSAKAWQGPRVRQDPPSRKGWLGRFPVSPGSEGGLPGALGSVTVTGAPQGGGPDLGRTEKQLLPLGEGTSVLVWEQRRACVHPRGCCPAQIATQRPLVPVRDRALAPRCPLPAAEARSRLSPTRPTVGPETACTLIGLLSIPGYWAIRSLA